MPPAPIPRLVVRASPSAVAAAPGALLQEPNEAREAPSSGAGGGDRQLALELVVADRLGCERVTIEIVGPLEIVWVVFHGWDR
jgi:hypothetical protein